MTFHVVIPVRYASTRLPGKALLDIAGKPMLARVYERAAASTAGAVVVATDDERIAAVAREFGAEVVMTGEHRSGTDRLAEAVRFLGLLGDDVVVNVQGDEPLIPPRVIDQVAALLEDNPGAGMATLAEPIMDAGVLRDPNVVKVTLDEQGRALYFSRAPIPWPRDQFQNDPDRLPPMDRFRRHIGIYAYRAGFLCDFTDWPMGHLEEVESLEQLRALERGVLIQVADAELPVPGGVDTKADLEALRARLAGSPA